MAVNNFPKEWVADDRGDVRVGTLLGLPPVHRGREKKCVIRKKSFDESARVAKVITVLSQVTPVTNEKKSQKSFDRLLRGSKAVRS